MAIIGTIRDRGRYILVGIVGLSLILFIAQNFIDKQGSGGDRGNLGTIDGDPVDERRYSEVLNEIHFLFSSEVFLSGVPTSINKTELYSQ